MVEVAARSSEHRVTVEVEFTQMHPIPCRKPAQPRFVERAQMTSPEDELALLEAASSEHAEAFGACVANHDV
jgi:hypothetical protein